MVELFWKIANEVRESAVYGLGEESITPTENVHAFFDLVFNQGWGHFRKPVVVSVCGRA